MQTTDTLQDQQPDTDNFAALRQLVTDEFEEAMAFNVAQRTLYTTDAPLLYEIFLANLPANERQSHTCHCCRRFFEQYGSLAVMYADGHHGAACWTLLMAKQAPEIYRQAIKALVDTVAKAKVTGVYLWSHQSVWGTPVTGDWTHLHVMSPPRNHDRRDFTAEQMMAQKVQDHGTLSHALADYSRELVGQALSILEADAVTRSEKFVGVAKFLVDLHDQIKDSPRLRRNFIWQAVAKAPAGWCTPRSSMIGTLLDDLQSGRPFDVVKRRWNEKMHPLQYQRPQAPPSAGNIAASEKLVEKLGVQASLQRRFARFEDVQDNLLWQPRVIEVPTKGGVFGHLKAKGEQPAPMPFNTAPTRITWEKFVSKVLPTALKIEVMALGMQPFCAMTAASDPTAPPILQWDREERRNTLAWFIYDGGSPPVQFNVPARWVELSGVTLLPCLWDGQTPERAGYTGAILLIKNARDLRPSRDMALFPGFLKNELHAARATIEAHSKSTPLTGQEEASACGLLVQKQGLNVPIKVTSEYGVAVYQIDRWD